MRIRLNPNWAVLKADQLPRPAVTRIIRSLMLQSRISPLVPYFGPESTMIAILVRACPQKPIFLSRLDAGQTSSTWCLRRQIRRRAPTTA